MDLIVQCTTLETLRDGRNNSIESGTNARVKTVTLLGSEDGVQTVHHTRAKVSNVVRVGSRVSHTHGHLSGINCSKGSGLVANRRRRSGLSSLTGGKSRSLVVVTREQSVDDGVLDELVNKREHSTTSDTLVNDIDSSAEDVADAGFQTRAVQEVGDGVSALLVTVGLSSNVRVRDTRARRSERRHSGSRASS